MENKVWFIADLHFGHANILKYHQSRSTLGNTIDEHDRKLAARWNATVGKRDTVYILGDMALTDSEKQRKLFQRLNGNKTLILGNHDKIADHNKCFFNEITQIKTRKFKKSVFPFLHRDLKIVMCHFPMLSWEHKEQGSIMLHGHCHGTLDDVNDKSTELRFDVGLDGALANYEFVSLECLQKIIEKNEKNIITSSN